jgi:hypothetical protein
VATFIVNLAVFGFGEFDGDASAKFAELDESVVVGFVFGLLGFWLGARLSQRIPLDHAPNEIGARRPLIDDHMKNEEDRRYTPSQGELASIRKGRAEINRGDYKTLEQLRGDLEHSRCPAPPTAAPKISRHRQ